MLRYFIAHRILLGLVFILPAVCLGSGNKGPSHGVRWNNEPAEQSCVNPALFALMGMELPPSLKGEDSSKSRPDGLVKPRSHVTSDSHLTYKILNFDFSDYEGFSSETLQIFFKKTGESYVPAARITDGLRAISITNINDSLRTKTKKALINNPYLYSQNTNGSFTITGGMNNPSYKDRLLCEDDQGNRAYFYVKVIHHTGVTEELLNMPECSVELGSDCVKLNLPNLNKPPMFLSDHTIMDPRYVSAIRKSVEDGKIFVLKVKSDAGKEKRYKVLGYKNSAYIHWDGLLPKRFFWRNIELLMGFEDANHVQPEEEITIDLWQQNRVQYFRNRQISALIKFLSLGSSCVLLYYLFQDKIHEVLGK
jgi:hypothetical protein